MSRRIVLTLVLPVLGEIRTYKVLFLVSLMVVCLPFSVLMLAQSGGGFTIERSVIPSGGVHASGGPFAVEVTNGQPIAHPGTSGGAFVVTSGFWNSQLAPTAASVSVSGRVMNVSGIGVTNATVVCSDAGGNPRTARTNGFGYYRIDDIQVGETYIFHVNSKQYSFPSRVVTVTDELADFDFVAQ